MPWKKNTKIWSTFPGKSYEELAPQLRGVPIDGYILLYRLVGEDIEIFRVVSGIVFGYRWKLNTMLKWMY